MLISCPNCATNFSVPDKALGATGRTLKCAKCGHKWHQDAPRPEDDFGLDEDSFPPPPPPEPVMAAPPRMDHDFEPVTAPSDLGMAPVNQSAAPQSQMNAGQDYDADEMEEPPIPQFGPHLETGDRQSEIDLDDEQPQPIPDVFSSRPSEKKGTGALWFLVFLLLLGGAGGAGYYYQDKVVEFWPPAHDIMADLGLRHEKPGAGLELRNAGTPERFVHNDTEVLIVRGIIANISDRERPVPTMRLVLLDKDKTVIQEKLAQPPASTLEPTGTVGFRIILERPDPNAVEVNVLFVDQTAP